MLANLKNQSVLYPFTFVPANLTGKPFPFKYSIVYNRQISNLPYKDQNKYYEEQKLSTDIYINNTSI